MVRFKPRVGAWLDDFLLRQASHVPLWIPVALGIGIALWFALGSTAAWLAGVLAAGAIAAAGFAAGGRMGRLLFWFGLLVAAGLALAWARAASVAAPRIERPVTATVSGTVERVERQVGRDRIRITLVDDGEFAGVRARLSFDQNNAAAIHTGDHITALARLMPPAPPPLPGGFDFARFAWFKGIGATGRALGLPTVANEVPQTGFWIWLDAVRNRLTLHVQQQLGGAEGGIGASLVTGDQGGVPEDVAQAMRDSGLTHLLSISGLHVAAVVGFFMVATRRLLALSMRAAIHLPLTLIGAGAGALAGVGYSLLAGGEVPTVRSCIAAILVLLGLAMGREAITLRLVAAGAFLILLFRSEALVSASFQLSFAAVTAIVALHELPWLRDRLMKREEPWWAAMLRVGAGLLLTGLVVEAALAPIGLYHFNRMGVYGAMANIVAIPLTTFVIMPLEAIALLFDLAGIGAPFWIMAKWALGLLVTIAHWASALPGGVALAPAMPVTAFTLMIAGGLWLALWGGWLRLFGALPFAAGVMIALLTPPADVLVTGDGRHIGIRAGDGRVYLLRPRAGDYIRDLMSDKTASALGAFPLDEGGFARCGRDACVADIWEGRRRLRLLATRSQVFIDRTRFEPACAAADIVVSERRLPSWCNPRWLKADRTLLSRTGGLAIHAATGRITSVAEGAGKHPWVAQPR